MGYNYLASISHYIPELIACLTMVVLILIESTYDNKETKKHLFYSAALIGLVSSMIAVFCNLNAAATSIFTGSIIIDSFGSFIKLVMIFGAIASIYLGKVSNDINYHLKSEFTILVIGVLIGGMLLTSANNMLLFYIGIETLSILSFALASFKKNDERSSEAGLKYSLYGGITSGIMLFGMSHIFGVLGTISFSEMSQALLTLETYQVAILAPSFLFFMAGIGYKIASVPFHMWAPDVYEGSPLPVTTFFSIVPKLAGMAALLRITTTLFSTESAIAHTWIGALFVIAALTMTVGNVSAIGQKSIKRMLAYSSISHAGFMMLGVLALNQAGASALLYYALAYLFMTIVAFAITSFIQDKFGNDYFDRFAGLAYKYPIMAVMMAIAMFSLAGVPPFAGFVAKFNILNAIILKGYYTLAVIAVLNSVISLYYYMKIIRVMFLKSPETDEEIEGLNFSNQFLVVVMTLPIIFLGIFWSDLIHFASSASIYIAK